MNMSMLDGHSDNDPDHDSSYSNADIHTSNHSDSDDSVEIPQLLSRTWDHLPQQDNIQDSGKDMCG